MIDKVVRTQAEKFRDAALESEADESEAAFDAKLKKIAKAASKEPKQATLK